MAGACQSWAMKHAACRWNRRRRREAWCLWCMVYGVRCALCGRTTSEDPGRRKALLSGTREGPTGKGALLRSGYGFSETRQRRRGGRVRGVVKSRRKEDGAW